MKAGITISDIMSNGMAVDFDEISLNIRMHKGTKTIVRRNFQDTTEIKRLIKILQEFVKQKEL